MEQNGGSGVDKERILKLDYQGIGINVLTEESDDFAGVCKVASCICRRHLKPENVVVISAYHGNGSDGGMAFTEQGMYAWEENDRFLFEIPYVAIQDLDYDSSGVLIYLNNDWQEGNVYTGLMDRRNTYSIRHNMRTKESFVLRPMDEGEEQEHGEEVYRSYVRSLYSFIASVVEELHCKNREE